MGMEAGSVGGAPNVQGRASRHAAIQEFLIEGEPFKVILFGGKMTGFKFDGKQSFPGDTVAFKSTDGSQEQGTLGDISLEKLEAGDPNCVLIECKNGQSCLLKPAELGINVSEALRADKVLAESDITGDAVSRV